MSQGGKAFPDLSTILISTLTGQSQQKYKRDDIIDEDKELAIFLSLIQLAFEPNSNGWTVNQTDPSIQTKTNPRTKRPIYRAKAKNKSNVTLQQIYDFYKCGYKREDATILYHVDNDHDILYGETIGGGPISSRDWQGMIVRFKIMNHKLLEGFQYNIVGFMLYCVPESHPLYLPSEENVIRCKCESQFSGYYQRVNARPNDFFLVTVRHSVQTGGMMPRWIENKGCYRLIKEEASKFYRECREIPMILEQRKARTQMKSVLASNDDDWLDMYKQLLSLGFAEQASKKCAKLYPNDFERAIDAIYSHETKSNEILIEKPTSGQDMKSEMKQEDNDIIYYQHVVDTKTESDDISSKIYKQLLEMGFSHERSLNAATLAPTNIINAINIATQIEEINEDMKGKVDGGNKISPQQSVNELFLDFLTRSGMEKYYDKFKENECCDLDSIAYFDDEFLKNDIGINKILRRKFLTKCSKMCKDIKLFKTECGINEFLYEKLSKYGVVTLYILCDKIRSKKDLKMKYEILNDKHCDLLWGLKQNYEIQNNEIVFEGN